MKIKIILYFLLGFLFTMISCNPDDPAPVNEEEVITTVTYTLTPKNGGTATVLKFRDADGDGGLAPVINGGTLSNGTTYLGVITMLNETTNPAGDVTSEVKEEGIDHQFFFAITNTLDGAFDLSYTDQDSKGQPIGLTTEMTTKKIATGELKLILRHLPNKAASGVKNGDITNAGGETDLEVSFPLEIK